MYKFQPHHPMKNSMLSALSSLLCLYTHPRTELYPVNDADSVHVNTVASACSVPLRSPCRESGHAPGGARDCR